MSFCLRSAVRTSLLAVFVWLNLVSAGAAQQSGELPPWLVGKWAFIDLYVPVNVARDKSDGYMGWSLDLLKHRRTLTLRPNEIDYDASQITMGGAGRLIVQETAIPLANLIGTDIARDHAGRRLNLHKLTTVLSVQPQTCYRESDRSDEVVSDNCVAFLVARQKGTADIFILIYQKTPINSEPRLVMVYRRLNAG